MQAERCCIRWFHPLHLRLIPGIGSPGPLRIRAAGLPGEYVAEAVLLAEDYQDEQASNNTLRAKFAVE